MNKFLPIGTVLNLKQGSKKIMICGRLQERDNDNKILDYCACYYPEGILNPDELFLFDHEDVDTIYFIGMQDSDEFAFREFLNEESKKLV